MKLNKIKYALSRPDDEEETWVSAKHLRGGSIPPPASLNLLFRISQAILATYLASVRDFLLPQSILLWVFISAQYDKTNFKSAQIPPLHQLG